MSDESDDRTINRELLKGVRVAQAMVHLASPAIRAYHELLLELLAKAGKDIPGHTKEQRELREAIDWITRP